MDELGRLLNAIAETRKRGSRAALATVVRVQGSAYRREGTKMLIGEDGSQVCMISGGCLEQEVGEIALRVIASGVPTVRHFDLDEDVMWGLGIGCGGSLDIYIEPFDRSEAYGSWLEAVEARRPACLATVIESSAEALVPVGARLFVAEDGTTSGGVHAMLDPLLCEQAGRTMAQLYPAARSSTYRGPEGSRLEVFLDVSVPPPELVLFGAGHDAIPLAKLATKLGFAVSVVDPRHAFVTAERFPQAGLVRSHPSGYRESVVLGPRSFVVIMNHHLERDRQAFAFALASDAPYIGVLGPRSRFEQIISTLGDEGGRLADDDGQRVRNPVGVDVGADSPEEIAVSVLAEVLAVRGGYQGGILEWKTRTDSPPARADVTAAIVLAAGESRRMGRPKLTLELDGETLLARALRSARAVADAVVVVVGAHEARYRPLAEACAAEVVANRDWQRGIGSSLRLGVAALAPASEWTLVTLADMPFVAADHLTALIEAHRQQGAPLVFSRYSGGRLGVPALLHRSRFAAALELPDDRGARALASSGEQVAAIDLPPRQAIDIDTPEDAARWLLGGPAGGSMPGAGG